MTGKSEFLSSSGLINSNIISPRVCKPIPSRSTMIGSVWARFGSGLARFGVIMFGGSLCSVCAWVVALHHTTAPEWRLELSSVWIRFGAGLGPVWVGLVWPRYRHCIRTAFGLNSSVWVRFGCSSFCKQLHVLPSILQHLPCGKHFSELFFF